VAKTERILVYRRDTHGGEEIVALCANRALAVAEINAYLSDAPSLGNWTFGMRSAEDIDLRGYIRGIP
jgi:hypothetical protein